MIKHNGFFRKRKNQILHRGTFIKKYRTFLDISSDSAIIMRAEEKRGIGMLSKCLVSFKKEPVLVIAALAALLSMVAVPPSAEYLSYVDVRVLCLLFCLMAVVAGLQSCNLFDVMAQRLLANSHHLRAVVVILILLPFFTSMVVTNDVALITFVPFSILVLQTIGRTDLLIQVIVLQTVAANLGSMDTPVSNPQNLFLYAHYDLTASSFFQVMLPLSLLSLLGLLAAAFSVPKDPIHVSFEGDTTIPSRRKLLIYLGLFLLCLLSVFHVLSYGMLTLIVLSVFLLVDKSMLGKVNYSLLLTFVCFFIFAGNIGAIEQVRELLTALIERNSLLSSLLASQLISNVPASVLLADFTQDWQGMLAGTNLGGLGTLIASLASLISFQYYVSLPDAKPLRYLGIFTVINLLGLVILVPMASIL